MTHLTKKQNQINWKVTCKAAANEILLISCVFLIYGEELTKVEWCTFVGRWSFSKPSYKHFSKNFIHKLWIIGLSDLFLKFLRFGISCGLNVSNTEMHVSLLNSTAILSILRALRVVIFLFVVHLNERMYAIGGNVIIAFKSNHKTF